MTPEGKVKKELREYLDSLGKDCWYYMPVPMGYGKRGVPDFIVCYKGFFLAPETKRKTGGVSGPQQDEQQAQIQAAGGDSGRITSIETLKQWIFHCDKLEKVMEDYISKPRDGN